MFCNNIVLKLLAPVIYSVSFNNQHIIGIEISTHKVIAMIAMLALLSTISYVSGEQPWITDCTRVIY